VRNVIGTHKGAGEREHYRIRWQDGHKSVYFPGLDVRVMPGGLSLDSPLILIGRCS